MLERQALLLLGHISKPQKFFFNKILSLSFYVLGFEPRASFILVKYSTTHPHPQFGSTF